MAWPTALAWAPNYLAIVLGAWVDRRAHKRRLMVLADLARACLLLTLPASYLVGGVTLIQLYTVALLTGTAGVLLNTAYPPFFAHLVPRTSYVDANSKLSSSRSASYVGGPRHRRHTPRRPLRTAGVAQTPRVGRDVTAPGGAPRG